MSTPPPPPPPPEPRPRPQTRLSFKLLGAELLWHRTPAPPGIDLRDYLAAQALAGLMLHICEDSGSPLMSKVARTAYRIADAMLAARAAGGAFNPIPRDELKGESDQRPGIA